MTTCNHRKTEHPDHNPILILRYKYKRSKKQAVALFNIVMLIHTRTIFFWVLLAMLPMRVTAFVVLPPRQSQAVRRVKSDEASTMLQSTLKEQHTSHRPPRPQNNNNKPWWTNLTNRLLLPPETRQRRQHRKQVRQQTKQALKQFPWPIRMAGNTLTSAIDRTLRRTGSQLDPLLQQAQSRLEQNDQVVAALGSPITVGNEISSSVSSTKVNGRKSQQTAATFYVHGSYADTTRTPAIGALIASGRKLLSLHVKIGGRTIAVDV